MTKLTDTQLVLLSSASQNPDGIISISERLKGSAAMAVGHKLIALGLAKEQTVRPPLSGWRKTIEGESIALVITAQGLSAIGVEDKHNSAAPTLPLDHDVPPQNAWRSGTKKALVITMLRQEDGTSISNIIAVTGWLPHTTRAFLTGIRKTGMHIRIIRKAGEAAQYQIVSQNEGAAA